jgi:HemY protein
MLRLIGFLIGVAIAAAGLAWLADNPGELTLQWQGYYAEVSVFTAIVILATAVVAVLVLWSLLRSAWNSPAAIGGLVAKRRQKLGIDALSSGMIALGAGDRAAAMRSAIQARKSLPNEPLTHLLRAQAAQLTGDRTTARRIFEAMLGSPDTEQLGLRGLYLEAHREEETEAARHFAERAVALNPKLAWAVDALFDLQCRQSDWTGALETLAIARKHGHVERPKADRRRAVLLTAQAQAAEEADPERALTLALEAHGLASDLIPAAAIAGRLFASRGNTPRAAKVLQRTWTRAPHPDLATAYAYARIGDSPRDRLDRTKQLAALSPNSIEGPVAVAAAAIEARQYDEARAALEPLLHGRLTQRVATLMARIEAEQHGDKGRVREWLARAVNAPRDPAWTADGVVADRWAAISPVTGALDAFRWRVPVEQLEHEGDFLSSQHEDLVALGMPRTFMAPDEDDVPQTVTAHTVSRRATAEPAATAKPAADELVTRAQAEPAPAQHRTEPAASLSGESAVPPAGTKHPLAGTPSSPPASPATGTPVRAPVDRSKDEPAREKRVFVPPHAPDDPGPETPEQEDVTLPLRPQRA